MFGEAKHRSHLWTPQFVVFLFILGATLALQLLTSSTPPIDHREASTIAQVDTIKIQSIPQQPIQQGVVFFYHVYKTGGTTIRWNYRTLPEVTFVRAQSKQQYDNLAERIDQHLSRKQTYSKPLVAEIHVEAPDSDFPTLLDVRPQLARWKTLSQQHNVPFFSFTLVREPLSFAVSFFNMFHAPKNRYSWNPFDLLEPTEANLRASLVPNRQCYILGLQGDGMLRDNSTVPEDCRQVAHTLLNELDWVGTTERMQTETLPLLTKLILGNSTRGERMAAFRPTVEPRRSLSMSNLTEETKKFINEHSKLDQELYEAVRHAEMYNGWRIAVQ